MMFDENLYIHKFVGNMIIQLLLKFCGNSPCGLRVIVFGTLSLHMLALGISRAACEVGSI
jgi:small basic protein